MNYVKLQKLLNFKICGSHITLIDSIEVLWTDRLFAFDEKVHLGYVDFQRL